MQSLRSHSATRQLAILAATLASSIGAAHAQDFQTLKTAKSPLVLAGQGSFYVGGRTVTQNETELGIGGPTFPPGLAVLDQMYVRYMIPQGQPKVPVAMVHGGMLSGKSYETTPDGRMGWDEYFVRKGHTVFVPDQVARARSGFDQSIYNLVRAGQAAPSTQPGILRLSSETIWFRFRFGPTLGNAFRESQFPVKAADEFAKQSVPSFFAPPVVATPNPTIAALGQLANKSNGLVVMTHSQSSTWGLDAYLSDFNSVRGSVLVEPQNCPPYTDAQINALKKLPILVVYADHIEVAERKVGFDQCKELTERINKVGGKASFLHLPAIGIRGNSHMIMMDQNNTQVADLIVKWLDRNIKSRRPWDSH